MKQMKKFNIPSWIKVLQYAKKFPNDNVSTLTKRLNGTYCHIHTMLIFFEEKELVILSKKGRSKYYELTEKGKNVAEHLNSAYKLLKIKLIDYLPRRKKYIEEQYGEKNINNINEEKVEYLENKKDKIEINVEEENDNNN